MGWNKLFSSDYNEYQKRNTYPAELKEIAEKKLSGKEPITKEEIQDFLIDLYLYEKKLKKNKPKKKARRRLIRN